MSTRCEAVSTVTGFAGSATLLRLTPTDGPPDPTLATTVGLWFLTCPGQSPAWSEYVLAAVHLREADGMPPARISQPGATHEVLLLALDPARSPSPLDTSTWRHLMPANVAVQIRVPDDDAARGVLRLAASAVADGLLWAEPPLSGQTEPWRSTLQETAAHFRGEHGQPC